MARPRRDPDAVPTVERILLAAEAAFGAEGFTRARLSDIAAAAGIRRSSLLYHFKTKELLYDAVVHRLFDELRIQFAATAYGRGTFDERLLALMQCWLDFISERTAFAPMVLRGILDGQGPVREHLNRELVPLLDWVEAWVSTAGADRIQDGVPLRAALLQLGSDALVRAASGPLRDTLWGEPMTLKLTRMLLMVPVEE